jgi:hypothetical protein
MHGYSNIKSYNLDLSFTECNNVILCEKPRLIGVEILLSSGKRTKYYLNLKISKKFGRNFHSLIGNNLYI